jgi:hypothetical protein
MCETADRGSYDVYYGNSNHVPVLAILLVWNGYTYGHVAVVSAVSATSITVAEQNAGRNGNQYPFASVPRKGNFFGSMTIDAGLTAKCLIHPKKLNGNSGASGVVPCTPGGLYCGSSLKQGKYDPAKLYRCDASGASLSIAENCAAGCLAEPTGHDDRCINRSQNWASPDNVGTTGRRGCENSRGTDGKQYWTCNVAQNGLPYGDGNLYRCEPDGSARYVKCPKGCSVQQVNHDDYCL